MNNIEIFVLYRKHALLIQTQCPETFSRKPVMNHECARFTSNRSSNIQVVFLFITARPADGIHQSTDKLQDTYDELKWTEPQKDGQQRHVPLHNVFGLNAFRPFLTGEQIPVWMNNEEFHEVSWSQSKVNCREPILCPIILEGRHPSHLGKAIRSLQ